MLEPKIIYEDENFLAVDKPAGMLVHPARGKRKDERGKSERTIVDWLLERYSEVRSVGDHSDGRFRVAEARGGDALFAC